MRALVSGAAGQLGRELQATRPPGVELAALSRAELDVTDAAAVERAIAGRSPDLVVNAAAYNAVDRAESEPEAAYAVNAHGVEALARSARRHGARFVHVSTDYVFDGARGRPYRPEDPPNPLSLYGASKLEGERRALAAGGEATVVVRTAWVHSRHGGHFAGFVLDRLRGGEPLRVADDQVGTPTWARTLAGAIWRLAERPRVAGILHWTDAGAASRYDLAVAIRDLAVELGLVSAAPPLEPAAAADFPGAARRPAYSVLDKRSTWRALEIRPLPWRAALRAMLAELSEAPDG